MSKLLLFFSIVGVFLESAISYDNGFTNPALVGSTCNSPKGEQGNCIPIRNCDQLLELLRNQRNRPDIREYLQNSRCGGDTRNPLVCCPQGSTSLPDPPNCGVSDVNDTPKIIGGQPSELGAWPWMAALGYRNNTWEGPDWKCAGALISSRFVLTTAHCLITTSATLTVVRLGDLDLMNDSDRATPLDIGIEKVIPHNRFRLGRRNDDIGLIKLKKSAPYTKYIRPICLPKTSGLRSKTFANFHPFVAGWGAQKFRGPFTNRLFEVQLPVINNQRCSQIYTSLKQKISAQDLCAGDLAGKNDTCSGDSGAPLMWPDKGIYYHIGIVAYGNTCAKAGFPGIYTRVTEYIDWILDHIN